MGFFEGPLRGHFGGIFRGILGRQLLTLLSGGGYICRPSWGPIYEGVIGAFLGTDFVLYGVLHIDNS